MNATITAAALAEKVTRGATTIRVLVEERPSGNPAPARRKTGVVTARVVAVRSRMAARTSYRGKAQRYYEVQTSAGVVLMAPAETLWRAPEDAAAVRRAHVEALALNDELPAAAPAAVEPVAAPAAPAADAGDDLDSLKFAELMELAKLHNVPGRGTARIGALRDGIRTARAEAEQALITAMCGA